jgi:competence protein ComEA
MASAPASREDWTPSRAKWTIVAVLASASAFGLSLSAWRAPSPAASTQASSIEITPPAASPMPLPVPLSFVGVPTVAAASVAPAIESADALAQPAMTVERRAPKASADPASLARRINLNTATQAELELLPRIGPALAQRILAYRAERGPFKSIDELDLVKGIGSKTLEKIRPMVSVE